MITPQAASVSVSIARGLIKFGQRLDLLWLERTAECDMILRQPPTRLFARKSVVIESLQRLVNGDYGVPRVADRDRQELIRILNGGVPAGQPTIRAYELFARYFPEQASVDLVYPDREFIHQLQQISPGLDWEDADLQAAFFSVSAGKRRGDIGYFGRVGLLVADVVAELGGEHSGLLTTHRDTAQLISTVLESLAEPNLDEFTRWQPLVEHALRATLGSVLDCREGLQENGPWIAAVFDAVGELRRQRKDDYALALITGKGVPQFVGLVMQELGDELDEVSAGSWRQISAAILTDTGRLIESNRSFAGFFQDHWADILGAALKAVEKHGGEILQGQTPIAQHVASVIIHRLAQDSNRNLLGRDTLIAVVDAAISVAASAPRGTDKSVGEPWLQVLLADVLDTMARQGVATTLTRAGVQRVVVNTLATIGDNPALGVENPKIVGELVGNLLTNVSHLPTFQAQGLVTAATDAALSAVADNPQLLNTKFAAAVAVFTGQMAEFISQRRVSDVECQRTVSMAISAIAMNPDVFAPFGESVAAVAARVVVSAFERANIVGAAGNTRAATIAGVLECFSRHGRVLLDGHTSPADFETALTAIIRYAVTSAKAELGRSINLLQLPELVYGTVKAIAEGTSSQNRSSLSAETPFAA